MLHGPELPNPCAIAQLYAEALYSIQDAQLSYRSSPITWDGYKISFKSAPAITAIPGQFELRDIRVNGLTIREWNASQSLERTFVHVEIFCEKSGITIKDVSDQSPYSERQGKTLGFIDNRIGKLIAAYNRNNVTGMLSFIDQLKASWNTEN